MARARFVFAVFVFFFVFSLGCGQTHQVKPVSIQAPRTNPNMITVAGAEVAAQAFVNASEAQKAFGYDIRGAGILPVKAVFDNKGPHTLRVIGEQTFLEDNQGSLWPVLSNQMAYDRASRFAETKEIFAKGAHGGFLGATAGAIVGLAVGVISGDDVGNAMGKGAVIGGAAGTVLGGTKQYGEGGARYPIERDIDEKTLSNKEISPRGLSYGIIFFPGEAMSARRLRLQLKEEDTGRIHTVYLRF
jgi:hypothetical protein